MTIKYLLFQGNDYEASGGMSDLSLKFNSYEEFAENYNFKQRDWYQLVDTTDFTYQDFYWFDEEEIIDDDSIDRDAFNEQRETEFYNWVKKNVR